MSSSANGFTDAEIGVFWDIVDCPIPEDLCPKSIFLKIKSALENIGYFGKISISAYSDMDQNPEDFESTGITLLPTGNKYVRINTMLEDLMLFAVDQKPKQYNILIISREITKDKLYVKSLLFLKVWNGNILLAQPENLAHDDLSKSLLRQVSAVWFWKSLSYGGKSIFHRGSSQTTCGSSQTFTSVVPPRVANEWTDSSVPRTYARELIALIASSSVKNSTNEEFLKRTFTILPCDAKCFVISFFGVVAGLKPMTTSVLEDSVWFLIEVREDMEKVRYEILEREAFTAADKFFRDLREKGVYSG